MNALTPIIAYDEPEVFACRALWAAVFREALREAVGVSTFTEDYRSSDKVRQANLARGRAYVASRDFDVVAEFAGVDADLARAAFNRGDITPETFRGKFKSGRVTHARRDAA